MQSEISEGADTTEIVNAIKELYGPLRDSLLLPDWQWRETATNGMLAMKIPQMEVYDSLVAKYETGSPQYAVYASTWTMVLTREVNPIIDYINSLPLYNEVVQSPSERERLNRIVQNKMTIINCR